MPSATPSDNELIHQAQVGDRRAFERFYERYKARIYNFVYRLLGNTELAEEATQDAFLAVHRNLHRYRPGKSAAPWLYRIARNKARSTYRRVRRHRKDISLDTTTTEEGTPLVEVLPGHTSSPSEMLRMKQYHQTIQNAVNGLPEKYRVVLILHDIDDVSYEEIQRILRLPYNTIATRLARARAMFRERIDPEKFGLTLCMRALVWRATP